MVTIAASLTIPARIAAQETDEPPLSLFPARAVWTLALNNPLTVPPVYFGTHAYFAIVGDRLVAYDLTRGSQEWLVPARPEFEPAAGDGLLFVSEPAALTAIRMGDGTTAWRLPAPEAGAPLAVAPVWDNGWLVLATAGWRRACLPWAGRPSRMAAPARLATRTPSRRSPPIASTCRSQMAASSRCGWIRAR